MARRCEKWGFLLWIFVKRREIGGVYWSVIGHRLRVGAMGVKGKVKEWCRLVWKGMEMWERGWEDGMFRVRRSPRLRVDGASEFRVSGFPLVTIRLSRR